MSLTKLLFGPNIEHLKEKRDVDGLMEVIVNPRGVFISQEMCEKKRADAVNVLIETENDSIQGKLVSAFQSFDDSLQKSVIDIFISMLSNNQKQRFAANVMKKIGWEPGKDETGAKYWAVLGKWSKCLDIGKPAAEVIIDAAKRSDETVRENIIDELLSRLTDGIKETNIFEDIGCLRLRSVINVGTEETRLFAAHTLQKIGWQPGRNKIGALFFAELGEWEGCIDIGKPATGILVYKYKNINDKRKKEITDALIAKLSENDRIISRFAADMLHRIGWEPEKNTTGALLWANLGEWDKCVDIGEPAIKVLINVIDQGEEQVRENIIDTLVSRLKGGTQETNSLAMQTLRMIGWEPGKDETGAKYWIAQNNFDKCSEIGRAAVKPLIKALEDDETVVRATIALMEIGGTDVVSLLLTKLDAVINKVTSNAETKVLMDNREYEYAATHYRDDSFDFYFSGSNRVKPYEGAKLNLVRALGETKDVRIIEPLMRAYQKVKVYENENIPDSEIIDAFLKLLEAGIVDPLLELLKREDFWSRHSVLRVFKYYSHQKTLIALLNNKNTIESLMWILHDKNKNMKDDALFLLSGLSCNLCNIDFLVELLKVHNKDVNEYVRKACTQIGKPAIEGLISVFREGNSDFRKSAIDMLCEIGTCTIESLITMLKDEKSIVRLCAIEVLDKIGDPVAVEPLIEMIGDSDAVVRKSVISTLKKFNDKRLVEPFIVALNDEDNTIRLILVDALGKIGNPVVVEPLIEMIGDNDAVVRKSVISAVKQFDDERIIEPLIVSLRDNESSVRRSAIEALCRFDDERINEPFIAAFDEYDSKAKMEIAHEMSRYNKNKAADLFAMIPVNSYGVRESIAIALGELDDPRALKRLFEILLSPHHDCKVRNVASKLIDKLCVPQSVDALIEILINTDNERVLKHVADCLWRIGDIHAVDALINLFKDESKYYYAKIALNCNNPLVFDRLLEALWDNDSQIVCRAVDMLAEMKDPRAVEPLIEKLKDGCLNAASALGDIGDARAVVPLIATLKNGGELLRKRSITALGKIGDPRAIESLVEALDDSDIYIQKFARNALQKLGWSPETQA